MNHQHLPHKGSVLPFELLRHGTGAWLRSRNLPPIERLLCRLSYASMEGRVGSNHFRLGHSQTALHELTDPSWSCWQVSNLRPRPYQGRVLPAELQQHAAGMRTRTPLPCLQGKVAP